jgi:CheY-like chemotaxis protein
VYYAFIMLVHPLPTRRVVLVEDDEVLQGQLVELLQGSFSDIDIRDAKNADDALHLLEDERSRLLITDAQNCSLDGIAVAASARRLRPTLPVIVMSNSGQAPRAGTHPPLTASWLKRPPKAERLVGLVQQMLSVPVGFTGSISIQGLPELVQLLCMTNVSGALRVDSGLEKGELWFERGQIVDAEQGGMHGSGVVQRMLQWQGGFFAFENEARAEHKTIHMSAMQLLLEAARVIDQEHAPSLRAEPEHEHERARRESGVQALGAVQNAAESFERGMELVRNKRYDAALPEWEHAAALEPDNRIYEVNLRRLREIRQRNV